ncbi:hypothetical protein LINPERPRIM_LOCUS40775, partial [Linum perenne]
FIRSYHIQRRLPFRTPLLLRHCRSTFNVQRRAVGGLRGRHHPVLCRVLYDVGLRRVFDSAAFRAGDVPVHVDGRTHSVLFNTANIVTGVHNFGDYFRTIIEIMK